MGYSLRFVWLGLAVLMFLLAGVAQERRLQRSDLPPAVQKAVERESKGATVLAYSTEVENGNREYEVEMTLGGHSRDVSIAPDGTVLEIEEQVEMKDLPQNVQKALRTKAKTGTIMKLESLTKRGRLVAYEAQVRAGGNHFEIQVGPNGNTLAHPE